MIRFPFPFSAMRYRTANETGFTLLELLVTLVVLGLLMVTLTQGIRVGLQAWGLEGRLGVRTSGLETTDRALRELIGRASPGDIRSRDAALTGTAHTLSFVTTLPEGYGASATHEADVQLLVTQGHRLELLWRPHYRRWIVPPPSPSAITLLDDVAQLDISFWQPGPPPQQGRWLTAWTERELPPLVRLRISFPRENASHWPDIVIAPMQELASP
jgi:general secretion pathway protein J